MQVSGSPGGSTVSLEALRGCRLAITSSLTPSNKFAALPYCPKVFELKPLNRESKAGPAVTRNIDGMIRKKMGKMSLTPTLWANSSAR